MLLISGLQWRAEIDEGDAAIRAVCYITQTIVLFNNLYSTPVNKAL